MVVNVLRTRDTARTLGISKDTVTATLKNLKDTVQQVNKDYLKKSVN